MTRSRKSNNGFKFIVYIKDGVAKYTAYTKKNVEKYGTSVLCFTYTIQEALAEVNDYNTPGDVHIQ